MIPEGAWLWLLAVILTVGTGAVVYCALLAFFALVLLMARLPDWLLVRLRVVLLLAVAVLALALPVTTTIAWHERLSAWFAR